MRHKKEPRIQLTPIEEKELFAEVDGKCPLCGTSLIAEKNGRRIRVYEAAHIYPHGQTAAQFKALKGVSVPIDVESPDNIILLCKRCHKLQDDKTSVADFLQLHQVKQEKSGAYRAAQETSNIELEPELKQVVEQLSRSNDRELVELSFSPLMIKRKIESDNLRRKVLNYVTTYYETLKVMFQNVDDHRSSTSEIIATQFKLAFIKQEREILSHNKEQLFDSLVEWVQSKSGGSRAACEAIVSFFIQDCEVFREIS